MVRSESDSAIKADDTYTYSTIDYKSYFDYWLRNSENVCSCCKHYDALCCDDCEHFYKLTEEDCKRKGLPYNPIGKERMWYFPIEGWDCRNTNDFEFCYKYNNSICKECLPLENVEISELYPKFESNGLII